MSKIKLLAEKTKQNKTKVISHSSSCFVPVSTTQIVSSLSKGISGTLNFHGSLGTNGTRNSQPHTSKANTALIELTLLQDITMKDINSQNWMWLEDIAYNKDEVYPSVSGVWWGEFGLVKGVWNPSQTGQQIQTVRRKDITKCYKVSTMTTHRNLCSCISGRDGLQTNQECQSVWLEDLGAS